MNKDRIILDVFDALVDADICDKNENTMEAGDVEYTFKTKENYCFFQKAMRKLQNMYDFEVQTFTNTEDNSHNLSISFTKKTCDEMVSKK